MANFTQNPETCTHKRTGNILIKGKNKKVPAHETKCLDCGKALARSKNALNPLA